MPYGLHSCVDGDLHLHSNDEDSDDWVVEAIWPGKTDYELCRHITNWSTYTVQHARNAWYVDGCSSFRITASDGNSVEHTIHQYPCIRSGNWSWPHGSGKAR